MKAKRIVLLLLAALLLQGCGSVSAPAAPSTSHSSTAAKPTETSAPEETAASSAVVPQAPDLEEADLALLAKTCKIDDLPAFLTETANTPGYKVLSFVPLEETWERYQALPKPKNEQRFDLKFPLDAAALRQSVEENTDKMLASGECVGRRKLNEADMQFCCDLIVKTLNAEAEHRSFPGREDDIASMLAHLAMFEGSGALSSAAICADGSMEFCRTLTDNMITITGYEEAPEIVVAHETEHILQKTCREELEELGVDYGYGFMLHFTDMEIHPLFWSWFVESAAETLAVAQYGKDPMTYKTQVGYLNSFSLLCMLRGAGHDDLARLTQQQDLGALFSAFGCETQEEQLELLQLFYTMEVIQQLPEAYMEQYAKENGIASITEKDEATLRHVAKTDVLQTMDRYFYQFLARRTETETMTLEDVFFLMSGWDLDLLTHLVELHKEFPWIYKPFLAYNAQVQEDFMTRIAPSVGLSAEELNALYHRYYDQIPKNRVYLTAGNEWRYHAVPGMAQEDCDFLNHLFQNDCVKKDDTAADYYHSIT